MESISGLPEVPGSAFRVSLLSDPPGSAEVPGLPYARVGIHVGTPCHVLCRRGGYRHRGTAVHGDIDVIPADTPSYWEINGRDTFLKLIVLPELLNSVAEELDIDPGRM